MRYIALLAASCCISGQASAQSSPDTAPAAQAPVAAGTIADIVVTAQRRAENLQKSALAIKVLGSEEIARAGVTQAVDLTRLVPGLQLAQLGSSAQPYIRGVGNAANTGATDSGVALNVDGVYVAQVIAYGGNFYDLARVEVLKGPQGTLYGRNATGGAINLITEAPGRDLGGYFTQEIGSDSFIHSTGALNVPVTDTLSVRGAFNFVRRDGYYRNGTGDDRTEAGRVRAKWASGGASILLNVDYAHQGGRNGGSAVIDGSASGGKTYNLVDPWAGVGAARYSFAQDTTQTPFLDLRSLMISSEMNIDLGASTTLTLLPAYRHVTQNGQTYGGGFLVKFNRYDFKQTSLEARVSHNTETVKAVLGAYYFNHDQNTPFHIDQRQFPTGAFGPLGTSVLLDVRPANQVVKSYSVFGETTVSVSDTLRVIGGLRYTHEKARADGVQTFQEVPFGLCSAAAPCVQPYGASVTSNDVSWKAGTEYDLSSSSMLFLTASTGFKAGGVFAANPPRNTYKPEKLLAFELGSRNRFFNNTLQVNVEGFFWKYTNKQETLAGYDGCGAVACGGTLTNLTVNAGKAELYGVSTDIVYRFTPADTLRLAGEYNHTEYKSFLLVSPVPANNGCAQSLTAAGFVSDCSGLPLTRAPRVTAMADYQHVFALGEATLTFGASANYTSSRYLDAHFQGMLKAPGYVLGNMELTYRSPGDRYSLGAYVRNIGNRAAPITAYSLADAAVSPFIATAVLNPPRAYGVRATVNF